VYPFGHPWRQSGQGMALTIHPYLAPRLKIGRAILVLPLCAFLAGEKVNFMFFISACPVFSEHR